MLKLKNEAGASSFCRDMCRSLVTIFKCLFIRPLIGQSCAQSQLAFRYFCCYPMYLTVQVVQNNNSQAETMSTVTPEHN